MKKITDKRVIAAIAVILSLALILVSLFVLKLIRDNRSPSSDEENRKIYLYPPDYSEDIFLDSVWLGYNRYVHYGENGMSTYLIEEKDCDAFGEKARFFLKYFSAVINGEYQKIDPMLTSELLNEKGKTQSFTKQKLYNIEVSLCNSFILNSGASDQINVYEFTVEFQIRQNNGTFCNRVGSDMIMKQIYQLYEDNETGTIHLNLVSNFI